MPDINIEVDRVKQSAQLHLACGDHQHVFDTRHGERAMTSQIVSTIAEHTKVSKEKKGCGICTRAVVAGNVFTSRKQHEGR